MSQFNTGNWMQNSNPYQAGQLGQQNILSGYQGAVANLNNAQQLNNSTTSGQQMQLGQQLQQNQGSVQQGLINSGLGNTTVAQTMQQAPLQTYNQGMANIQNQQAMRGMGIDQALAGASQQTGNALGQAQNSNYQQQIQGLNNLGVKRSGSTPGLAML